MTSTPETIARQFLDDCVQTRAHEAIDSAEWIFAGAKHRSPSPEKLREILCCISSRDILRITIAFEGGTVSVTSDEPADLAYFLEQYESHVRVRESEDVSKVTIAFSKTVRNQTVSLYSLETFAATIQKRTWSEVLAIFSSITNSEYRQCIELQNDEVQFATRTISFSPKPKLDDTPVSRSDRRTKRTELVHFDGDDAQAIPDDFFLERPSPDANLNNLLNRVCYICCISFISDMVQVETAADKYSIFFKLNGYRSISSKIDLAEIDASQIKQLFGIYEWIYSGGTVADKVGLARNIISLHWNGDTTRPIENGTFNSILSGYEIYLRENVRQYIEVKNKLSDFLMEFSGKANKLAENFGDKLEKNVIAFIGFFISSVLVKVITDKTFSGVFTVPLAIVAFIIIGFSVLHLFASVLLFNKDKTRLADDFERLKTRYADLLNKNDLDRIFDRTGGLQQLSDYLAFKRRIFCWVWVIAIVVFIGIIIYFTSWTPEAQTRSAQAPAISTNASTASSKIEPKPKSTNSSRIQLVPDAPH